MKVYAKHYRIQEFLKEQSLDGITVVDSLKECHYYISGRYKDTEFHDNLKGVIIPYTGHNGIDLNSMRKRNLRLFVTPTRSKYVAEKAMALMLGLLGKSYHYHELLKEGNWAERNSESRVPWVSIQGKTVGLFGYGRIGKLIHKMLKGFDCEIYTIDREKEYPNDVKTVKNLTNLVQVCDVLFISTPLNETTEGIFDQQLLNRMKYKFLINVGRGKIVDEEALYNALTNNKLMGYASDVWYNYPKEKEECLPCSYPIQELDNVLMSNHSGGYTIDTNDEVNQDIVKTLMKLKNENFEDELDVHTLL